MPAAAAMLDVYEAHEERIQRLESGLQDVSTGLATNTAKLEALGDKMDLSAELISKRVEACVLPLAHKLDTTSEKVDQATQQLSVGNERFARLEAVSAGATRRWRLTKKLLLPLAVGGTGWLGHQLWDVILHLHK